MRQLSPDFMHALTKGFLAPITRLVREDMDLDLHIRDNYLNAYYKGSSLLKLSEVGTHGLYRSEIHPKYLAGMTVPDLIDDSTTAAFVEAVPELKENIISCGRTSLEVEYEQMFVRSNNGEVRSNTDYFVVDRQYALGRAQLDLLGFLWPSRGRQRGQVVVPCVIEIKFALNPQIRNVKAQLQRYYDLISAEVATVSADMESSFHQRLDLGLYDQSPNRLSAMRTLLFPRDISQYQFMLLLVDYNPHSTLLDLEQLAELPFADQLRIYFGGLALWEEKVSSPRDLVRAEKARQLRSAGA